MNAADGLTMTTAYQGEQTLLVTRPTRLIALRYWTAMFLFLAFLAFVTAELKRRTTRYIITDNKIIREDGILNKNTEMVPYTQLERVDLHQTLGQRILKIGTIVVDTGDDVLNIDMVRHPAKVQELLSARLGRRAWTGQQPPPTR